jgi:hypothetical protein
LSKDGAEESSVMPAELVELAEQALVEVTNSVESGAPVVLCQLQASGFYEALKIELRDRTESDAVKRDMLAAVAGQCDRIAIASISPGALLGELRNAIAMLRPDLQPVALPRRRPGPILRVIQGGLARN